MCLIIYKKETSNVFNDTYMKTSISRNSDGAGVMYVEDGRVRVEKIEGTTNKSILEKDIFDWCKQMFESKDTLIMHHRMTTDGSNHLDNIHPYKVLSIDDGDSIDLYMMHNGIITKCRPPVLSTESTSFHNYYNWKGSYLDADYDDEYTDYKGQGIQEKVQPSDTQIFINDYLTPLLKQNPELLYTDSLQKFIESFIGVGNKLVFLDSTGRVTIINEKQGTQLSEAEGGCWISNTYSHLPRQVYTYTNVNKVPAQSTYILPKKEEDTVQKTHTKNKAIVDRYYGNDYDYSNDYEDEYLGNYSTRYNSKPFWENKTPEEVVDLLCMTSNFDDIGDLILNDIDMAEEVMSHLLDFYWTNNHKYTTPTKPSTASATKSVVKKHTKINKTTKNIENKKLNVKTA